MFIYLFSHVSGLPGRDLGVKREEWFGGVDVLGGDRSRVGLTGSETRREMGLPRDIP